MINGVLSGLLIAISTVWAWYVFHRLWVETIEDRAQGGISAAVAAGLVLQPAAFRARRVATGHSPQGPVRVEWRGGLLGLRSVVWVGGRRRALPLITDSHALAAALGPG